VHKIGTRLPVPTLNGFQNATGLLAEGNAYMQRFFTMDNLKFKEGKIYFEGNLIQPISEAEIQKPCNQ